MWIIGFLITLLYLAVGAGIICLIALWRGKKPKKYLFNEDNWFPVLCGMVVVELIIAASIGNGPALLLPEKFPSPEIQNGVKNLFSNIWSGTDAKNQIAEGESLPWANGTWFWWALFWVYLFSVPVYGVIAFQDNVRRGIAKAVLRRRRTVPQGAAAGAQAAAPQAAAGTGRGQGFGARLVVEFLAEIVAELVILMFRKRGIR